MAFLRRIRSPRDREEHCSPPQSSGGAFRPGHRRYRSDESAHIVREIPDTDFLDGNPLSQPLDSHEPFPEGEEESAYNPPLPPRVSMSKTSKRTDVKRQNSDDDPYYLTPVDTIRRGPANLALPTGAAPTRSERRLMEIHQRTLSQRQDRVQDGSFFPGHRRAGSSGHVVDTSEYSTPWNALHDQRHGGSGGGGVPPVRPPRSRSDRTPNARVAQTQDTGEDIIVVQGGIPSEDGSRTSSPGSPPVAAPAPPAMAKEAGDDYDEPWDRRFKNFHIHSSVRSRGGSRFDDEHPRHSSVGSRSHHHSTTSAPLLHHPSHHSSHPDLPPPPSFQPPPPPIERDSPPPPRHFNPPRISPPMDELSQRLALRSHSDRGRILTSPPLEDMRRQRNARSGSDHFARASSPVLQQESSLSQPEASRPSSSGLMSFQSRSRHRHRRLPSPPFAGTDVPRHNQADSPSPPFIDLSLPLKDQP